MKMICLCGISGSGKTTWAKRFMSEHPDWLYFNPDEYYAKINGNECDRRNTFEIWHSLFRDVHTAALNSKNVLIDSDNLTFHQRMQWIEWFPEFEHYLIYFYENLKTCYERVQARERKLPYDVLVKKFKIWENPSYCKDYKYWTKVMKGENKNDV